MTIYDITRTISPTLKVWPGDAQYRVNAVLKKDEGAAVNLTTLTLSAHTGTHADAYFHYTKDGAHPAQMPLVQYIGPVRVVTVTKRDGPLEKEDFAPGILEGARRLLIHSHVSDLPDDVWPEEFPYPSVALIEYLGSQGYVLIGLDSPSFDELTSTALEGHHALARNQIVNLETLNLRGVPDGDYELAALPLKLDEACGSPVRAVLRSLTD
jgi:arylformamidase